jgi:hypothetical protein
MKHFACWLIYLVLLLTACQSDSAYVIGTYRITILPQMSSCPPQIFEAFADPLLFPEVTPERQYSAQWQLERVGISSSGADKVLVTLISALTPAQTLEVTGMVARNTQDLRIEQARPLQQGTCELTRFVLIYGVFDNRTLSGEIRQIFTNPTSAAACQTLSPFMSCEVYATFAGYNLGP